MAITVGNTSYTDEQLATYSESLGGDLSKLATDAAASGATSAEIANVYNTMYDTSFTQDDVTGYVSTNLSDYSFNDDGVIVSSATMEDAEEAPATAVTTTDATSITDDKDSAIYVDADEIPDIEADSVAASSYEASTFDIDADTMTVAGQLEGLLAADSDYMDYATTQGLQTAASSGLLNTSMAATAAQSSAIDAAYDIASQDASTYYSAATANQDAVNEALSTSAQLEQDAATTSAELSLEADTANAELALEAFTTNADNATTILSQELQQEGLNYRQEITNELEQSLSDAEIAAEYALTEMKYDAADREMFVTYYDALNSDMMATVLDVYTDADLDDAAKEQMVTELTSKFTADVELYSELTGVTLTDESLSTISLYEDETETTDTTTTDTTAEDVTTALSDLDSGDWDSIGTSVLAAAETDSELAAYIEEETGQSISDVSSTMIADLFEGTLKSASKGALAGGLSTGGTGALLGAGLAILSTIASNAYDMLTGYLFGDDEEATTTSSNSSGSDYSSSYYDGSDYSSSYDGSNYTSEDSGSDYSSSYSDSYYDGSDYSGGYSSDSTSSSWW